MEPAATAIVYLVLGLVMVLAGLLVWQDEQQAGVVGAGAIAGDDALPVGLEIEHRHLGALIQEPGREGVAELAETAGDDDHAVLEVETIQHAVIP